MSIPVNQDWFFYLIILKYIFALDFIVLKSKIHFELSHKDLHIAKWIWGLLMVFLSQYEQQ